MAGVPRPTVLIGILLVFTIVFPALPLAQEQAGSSPEPTVTPQRIRVGGAVESAKVISSPRPGYPEKARRAGIQGVVRLAVVIGKDGSVESLKVIAGDPLLADAARSAVSKWRYQPTVLNGEPVEVDTEIDVNFTLARAGFPRTEPILNDMVGSGLRPADQAGAADKLNHEGMVAFNVGNYEGARDLLKQVQRSRPGA